MSQTIIKHDIPSRLRRLLLQHGRMVHEDGPRFDALLRDYCGATNRNAIRLLVLAAEEGIPTAMLTADSGVPLPVLLGQLARRMEQDLAMTSDAAQWATETWACALGLKGCGRFDWRDLGGLGNLSSSVMDGAPAVDAMGLKAELQEQLDRCLEKVVAGVNAAAPGRLLADTEGRAPIKRRCNGRSMRRKPLFPPPVDPATGKRCKNHGRQNYTPVTTWETSPSDDGGGVPNPRAASRLWMT